LVAALQLIDVTSVAGAGRIPGIVQLEIEQTKKSLAVEIEAQLLEITQQRPLCCKQGRSYPARAIAADLLAPLQSLIGADAGGAKIAPGTAKVSAIDQLADAWSS
jgi:hypothetical protein